MGKHASFIMVLILVASCLVMLACKAPEPDRHAVSFDTHGGSAVPTQSVPNGQNAFKPGTDPTRDGYAFRGWYKDEACSTAFNFSVETIRSDTTIHAGWDVEYTVSFDSVDGSEVAPIKVRSGAKAKKPADPVNPPLNFKSWYRESGHVNRYAFNEPVTGNITLYAQYTDEMIVTFMTGMGSHIDQQFVRSGGKASRPDTDPVRSGYSFGGWYKDRDCGAIFDFNSEVITANTNIYAKWLSWKGAKTDDGRVDSVGGYVNTDYSINLQFIGDAPCIAFSKKESNSLTKLNVLRWDGSRWLSMLSSTPIIDNGSAVRMVAKGGVLHVLYEFGNHLYLMKHTGVAWETYSAKIHWGEGSSSPCLAVDDAGIAYVAYLDSQRNAHVVRQTTGAAWEEVATRANPDPSVYQHHTIIGLKGTVPYLLDMRQTSAVMSYSYTSSAWFDVGGQASQGAVTTGTSRSRFGFDEAGNIYLAYAKENGAYHRATVRKYDGTSWSTLGADDFSDGDVDLVDMDFLGSTSLVAYQDDRTNGTVMQYDGSAWKLSGSIFSSGAVLSLDLEVNNDTAYVAYVDSDRKIYLKMLK